MSSRCTNMNSGLLPSLFTQLLFHAQHIPLAYFPPCQITAPTPVRKS